MHSYICFKTPKQPIWQFQSYVQICDMGTFRVFDNCPRNDASRRKAGNYKNVGEREGASFACENIFYDH